MAIELSIVPFALSIKLSEALTCRVELAVPYGGTYMLFDESFVVIPLNDIGLSSTSESRFVDEFTRISMVLSSPGLKVIELGIVDIKIFGGGRMKSDLFFDETSKRAYNQLTKNSSVQSRVMLNIEQFEIGSRYVTANVQNRYGEKVTINIQGGRPGIELQESFFKIKEGEKRESPLYAYLITRLIQDSSILARKLPVVGKRDWLLIYEDTLLELSVKDAYDELEIVLVFL
jgi:hypothetical protein